MKNIKYKEIIDCFKQHSINVKSNINNETYFENIKSISSANNKDLSFFSNLKYIDDLKKTKAKACLIKDEYIKYLPIDCEPIIVNEPYLALAALSKIFSDNNFISNGIISQNSSINEGVEIKNNVQIDDYCKISSNTSIDNNVIIGSNSVIGPNVVIHKNCIIHNNVSIANSVIFEDCEIYPGARIGYSGFGFEEKSKQKIYHHGNVIIGKNSSIGSNTTIDRSVFDSTIIGEYSQIDNLVQIAHNVIIGKHSIIAAQVGIAGSTNIGDYVKIGGQAGIAGHLEIGKNVTIAGKSGVTKNINDNEIVAGFPAKNINLWKRDVIKLSKLK